MSIQSMTGFGRSEIEGKTGNYKVEVKSVNNRYFNVQFRMPSLFNSLEQKMKQALQDALERGSVNVSIFWEAPTDEIEVTADNELAAKYVTILKSISSEFELSGEPAISDLAPFYREIITQKLAEFSDDELWDDISKALEEAIVACVSDRSREGDFTVQELKGVVYDIENDLADVVKLAPARIEKYKEKLQRNVEELKGEGVDESRLAFEITLMSEKLDIAEEVTRLSSHIVAMKELLSDGISVGKRMGFLLQEFNREVNTIGSKANDASISNIVVAMKESVEKMREQSLNLV